MARTCSYYINGAPITGSLAITTVDSGVIVMIDRPTTALSFTIGWEVEAGYSATTGAATMGNQSNTITIYTSRTRVADGVSLLNKTTTSVHYTVTV